MRVAKLPKPRRNPANVGHPGDDYTPDELEFMRAVDQFKRRFRKPFPTCREILDIVFALGYRKE